MFITRNLFVLLAIFTAVACHRAPQNAEPTTPCVETIAVEKSFTTASMNIGCHFVPAGFDGVYRPRDGGPELQCDRVEPVYVRVSLGPVGPALIGENPGDQGCCGTEMVMPDGVSESYGPFVCGVDEGEVLKCMREDGAGFVLSRDRAELIP